MAGGTPETHTSCKLVVVEYFGIWFQYAIHINEKRSIRNLSFHVSSDNFATFLSQTSKLVHSSLHLVIQVYQP